MDDAAGDCEIEIVPETTETAHDAAETEPANVWMTMKDTTSPKKYGIKSNPEEEALEVINQEIMEDEDFQEVDDLPQKLAGFKEKFLSFEKDSEGNIDMFGLSRMLEKLGQPKTHLEMRKMIREVDKSKKGTICYKDFVTMMCGPKASVLKLILIFEEKTKAPEVPVGVAPKRDLKSLP